MMLTCTNHCSQCGRHFHSLEAFDLHHDHDETGWPVCLDPVDLEDRDGRRRLVELGRGECRMYREVECGVAIWTKAGYEQVARAFSHAAEDFAEAAGGPGGPDQSQGAGRATAPLSASAQTSEAIV